MKSQSLVLRAGVVGALMTIAGSAGAYGQYAAAFPNGVNSPDYCIYCHTDAAPVSPAPRSAFGLLVEPNTPGNLGAFWTTENCQADTDGDGQSNGQELGDPCCDWATGETPARTADISNPSDANATSADPDNPSSPADCPPDSTTGTSGTSSGGTGTSGAGAGNPGEGDSVGAGPAKDPPPISQGACAVDGAPGGDGAGAPWALAALGVGLAALVRGRRARR